MISGQCLCGAHRFELEGKLEFPHHCHCGHCRKQHGSAYASLVGVADEALRWQRGDVIAYASSAGFTRESCATCGSPLPQNIEGLPIFVPAGCLDGLEQAMEFHIFVGSKAPWFEITDGCPTFEAFPPGVESESVESRPLVDPPEGVRGSCLCGELRYVVEGPALAARHCHCTRCRLGRGAAHASNLIVSAGSLRFTSGEDLLRRYKVPEAKYFTQSFCGNCGGKAPTVDAQRKVAIVPMGSLDDPPPLLPQEHIWVADLPAWNRITDDLPQCEGAPG